MVGPQPDHPNCSRHDDVTNTVILVGVSVSSDSKRHKITADDSKNKLYVIFIHLSYLTFVFGVERWKFLCFMKHFS